MEGIKNGTYRKVFSDYKYVQELFKFICVYACGNKENLDILFQIKKTKLSEKDKKNILIK